MKILEKRVSGVNGRVVVAKSLGLGIYIQVMGLTQSGGIVTRIWKQTLKNIKKLKPDVKNSLILGLGGGTAAGVIKNLWPEANVTGVEIDPVMVELGRKYLDLSVDKLYIGDGQRAVARVKLSYDLILVDCYLGDKFPEKFEELSFLKKILKILKPAGIAVFNRLYYGDKRKEAYKFGEKLKKVFPEIEYFYPDANVMFICRT